MWGGVDVIILKGVVLLLCVGWLIVHRVEIYVSDDVVCDILGG